MIGAVATGVFLIGLAVVYFITPANHLPSFIPGFDTTITRHHFTHGIASLFLGLGAFVFVWFTSGKKSSEKDDTQNGSKSDAIEGERP